MFPFNKKPRPEWDKPLTLGDLAQRRCEREEAAKREKEQKMRRIIREEVLAVLQEHGLVSETKQRVETTEDCCDPRESTA